MDWDKILKEQEGTTYAAIPAGKYPITVLEAQEETASTGAKMIKTTCVIDSGPYAERKLITNIVFSVDNPDAMRFTIRKLNALGVPKETLSASKPTLAELAKMITGAKAEADVSVRPYEGEDKNDIRSFKRLDGPSTAGVTAPPPITPPTATDIPIPIPPTPTIPAATNEEEPF